MQCLPCFNKKKYDIDFKQKLRCQCLICGHVYTTLEKFIEHIGGHDLKAVNKCISLGRGTVKCMKCDRAFANVYKMATAHNHGCLQSLNSIVVEVP